MGLGANDTATHQISLTNQPGCADTEAWTRSKSFTIHTSAAKSIAITTSPEASVWQISYQAMAHTRPPTSS